MLTNNTYDLSPEDWRDKLVARLNFDTPTNLARLTWYLGQQRPPAVPKEYRPSYALLLDMSTNDYAGLVVDAIADRLELTGMRLDQPQADLEIWRILEENHIDATQRMVHTEALIMAYGYMSVWPTQDEDIPAAVVPESALQTTHEEDPATGETIAALKMWTDDIADKIYCNLYLPDFYYRWEADTKPISDTYDPDAESTATIRNQRQGETYNWRPRGTEAIEDDDRLTAEIANPLKPMVPIVPFANRPLLSIGGLSEIDPLIPVLKRIDKLTLDQMLAAEAGAFKQKWATGLDIPVDPDTDEPIEVFDAAIRKLWISDSPDTKFGDFNATDLRPYISAIEAQVATASAISRVPAYYLLNPSLVNPPSAETAMAADAGLVQKVTTQSKTFGESYEQVVRLILKAADDPRAEPGAINMEAVWEDPRIRSEAQVADAAVKWATLGVPEEVLWTWAGASPEEVARWRTINAQQALTAAVLAPTPTVEGAIEAQEDDPDAAPTAEQVDAEVEDDDALTA